MSEVAFPPRGAPVARLAAVVLAAGAGSRFGGAPGGKLLADLDGRPLLDHVLRAVRAFAPAVTVVILGYGAKEIERAIDWAGEVRVRNPDPARGLASSLQAGFAALERHPGRLEGAFIVLGDQPLLRVEVMRALAEAAGVAGPAGSHGAAGPRSIVVPRYSEAPDAGQRNPALVLRAAWPLIADLAGDRGLGLFVAERPELVLEVPVGGANPDVDTPADLGSLAGRAAAGEG